MVKSVPKEILEKLSPEPLERLGSHRSSGGGGLPCLRRCELYHRPGDRYQWGALRLKRALLSKGTGIRSYRKVGDATAAGSKPPDFSLQPSLESTLPEPFYKYRANSIPTMTMRGFAVIYWRGILFKSPRTQLNDRGYHHMDRSYQLSLPAICQGVCH